MFLAEEERELVALKKEGSFKNLWITTVNLTKSLGNILLHLVRFLLPMCGDFCLVLIV